MRKPLEKGSATDNNRVRITDGSAEVEVAPAQGGCITAFRWQTDDGPIDWLRPAPAGGDFPATAAACFPLVPYSNRIRDGHFVFQGRDYQLAENFQPSPHSIHGHGWQAPWRVAAAEARNLTLVYDHRASDWPAPYLAEQRFELVGGALRIDLAVTNKGARAMPAGLGLHPYFPRTPACRLTAAVGQMWAIDDEVMPTQLVAPAPGANPADGLQPAQCVLDNCFTEFSGRAVIDWPERRASLALEADPALVFLVVFTPPQTDFFCVEPVSNVTDAVNLTAEDCVATGLRVLEPGERFVVTTRFTPRLEGAS